MCEPKKKRYFTGEDRTKLEALPVDISMPLMMRSAQLMQEKRILDDTWQRGCDDIEEKMDNLIEDIKNAIGE